jgi:hypothetical protein
VITTPGRSAVNLITHSLSAESLERSTGLHGSSTEPFLWAFMVNGSRVDCIAAEWGAGRSGSPSLHPLGLTMGLADRTGRFRSAKLSRLGNLQG